MYGIFHIRSVSVGLDSQIWYLFIYITGYLNGYLNRINIRNDGFPDVRWPSSQNHWQHESEGVDSPAPHSLDHALSAPQPAYRANDGGQIVSFYQTSFLVKILIKRVEGNANVIFELSTDSESLSKVLDSISAIRIKQYSHQIKS